MNVASRSAGVAAAIAGAGAVVLGAFGAHALRGTLDPGALAIWHTAVEYQFWHALALLVVAQMLRTQASTAATIAASGLVVGMLLFCGSLYALALGAPRVTGIATPFGGLAFIVGWIALGFAAWRNVT
ncbi:MAG: DUF423 domain-containing protein [Rhodanobacteraceae bacterium]